MDNFNVYEAIVEKVKDNHEEYDLTYTAFRALCHSTPLCEALIEEIISIYEKLLASDNPKSR